MKPDAREVFDAFQAVTCIQPGGPMSSGRIFLAFCGLFRDMEIPIDRRDWRLVSDGGFNLQVMRLPPWCPTCKRLWDEGKR